MSDDYGNDFGMSRGRIREIRSEIRNIRNCSSDEERAERAAAWTKETAAQKARDEGNLELARRIEALE